jgi:hypothetical protein
MLPPRLAKVATSAVSVAVVTLAQLNLASPAFWAEQRAALYAVIVVLVGVALTEVFGSVFGYSTCNSRQCAGSTESFRLC